MGIWSTSLLLRMDKHNLSFIIMHALWYRCSNDHDSALQLMVQLDDLKRKSQQLVQDAILVLSCLKVSTDIVSFV